MKIYLTRTYYNNDVTHGVLSFEGDDTTFVTLEKALPKPHQKYKNRCLPEGEYPCAITYSPFMYKGMVIRAPFISIKSVPFFNNVRFTFDVEENPTKHVINVGVARDEGLFKIVTDCDTCTRYFARLSKRFYDEQQDCETEDVTLVVRHAEDIAYEDTSVEQIEKQLAYEKEMMEKEALLNELS